MHKDLHTELAWERDMMLLGAELWDKRNEKAPFIQTSTGRRFIKHTIEDAVRAIEGLKLVMRDTNAKSRAFLWLDMLDTDTVALYVLGAMVGVTIDHTKDGHVLPGATMHKLAIKVARSIQDEINLRHMIAASREETALWKAEKGIDANIPSIVDKALSRGGYDRRRMYKLRKKYEGIMDHCEMPEDEALKLGDALLQCMVHQFPDYWSVELVVKTVRGSVSRRNVLRMSDQLREDINDVSQSYRVTQSQKLPTLIEPKEWT